MERGRQRAGEKVREREREKESMIKRKERR